MATNNILMFPGNKNTEDPPDVPPVRCDLCVHYTSGVLGDYCRAFNEDLFDVGQAESCNLYETV
jgi:hypothetical protein